MTADAPAYYALAPGGWRDYVTLLHPPYTLWHLSYVVVGASLAGSDWTRLAALVAAFALAMGVGAHALDELHGRPLRTRIPGRVLWTLAALGLAGACAIGIWAAASWTWWLLAFVPAGAFIAVAYNLELFGGRFHSDAWFGLAWGAFPVLTGYFAVAERFRVEAFLAAAFAYLGSRAQRSLSSQVREVRRRVEEVSGTVLRTDGGVEAVTKATLTSAPETALRALVWAHVALAAALATLIA
jgi:hypothetical protein